MGREKLFISAIIFIMGVFLFCADARTQEECATSTGWSGIRLNEISSYSSSNDWVELYNILDVCVNLDGLKLWDSGVSSAMRVLTGDIFAHDFLSVNASNRLGRDADSVVLRNEDNELGRFNYGTTEFPAALENEVWAREIDGLGDWKITTEPTSGSANSIVAPIVPPTTTPPIDPPTTTPPIEPPTSTPPTSTPPVDPPTSTPPIDPPTTTPTSSPVIDWAMIKINEFVSNPTSGNEWVELFNLSENDIDLTGATICDNREIGCKNIAGTILANSWFYFDLLSTSFLNNDGDSVIVKNPELKSIDRIDYDSIYAPKKGESLARRIDGIGEFAISTQITPGEANVIVAPVVVDSGGSSNQSAINMLEAEVATSTCEFLKIYINELYPNPPGSDSNDEFIEIINLSSSTISLDGWKLTDTAESFILSGVINPGQILFWKRAETKIALNNTAKETVKLFDSKKCEIDSVSYDKADEGESLLRDEAGEYFWTNRPTPGKENIYVQKDNGIVWKIRYPLNGIVGENIIFDAEDSADDRGGEIIFDWDFGDSATSSGAIVSHIFSHSGEYQIALSASSTSGSCGLKTMSINISAPMIGVGNIIISEIFANPSGTDDKEYIEIFNSGENDADLTGWVIRSGSGTPYVLPTSTKINAGKYLVFYKTATKISISNIDDKIFLINNENRLIDMIRIGKSKTDESYSLINEEWKWSQPTPSEPNTAINLVVPVVVAKKIITYPFVDIKTARQMDKDDGVKTKGAVTVLPQMFGKQFFYIFDGISGIQIYQYQGKFPMLKIGDLVEVKGVLSEASGVKRIKLKNVKEVDILAIEKNIQPINLQINELNEEYLGALVKVEGEITSKKTNFIYLDDGQGEIKIYFKQNAKIDKSVLKEGGRVSVIGVLEINAGEITILPRLSDDVVVVSGDEIILSAGDENLIADKSAKETAEKYLTATAGGLTALILGFLSRARGMALVGLIKKIATKFITRV